MVEELLKMPDKKLVAVIAIIFSAIGAPFWYLNQWHHELFSELDLIKLLIFCLVIGFPVFLVNFFAISFSLTPFEGENIVHLEFIIGAVVSLVGFYAPSFVFLILSLWDISPDVKGSYPLLIATIADVLMVLFLAHTFGAISREVNGVNNPTPPADRKRPPAETLNP